MNTDLQNAYTFFKQHAGGIVGESAQVALMLAKAEQWAEDHGLVSLTEQDTEQAYCYCDSDTCKYHEGSDHTWETVVAFLVKPCEQYSEDACDLSCRHTDVLASLGGIMEPTSDYLRTIHAELALEAMESTKQRTNK